MPKRKDIKKILVIGAGPIIIGQACEFDYSGTQACKALKEEGYRVILVNSNPATIMTDPELADRTYVEPINMWALERILDRERPDAVLTTLGGQTALNLAVEAAEAGLFERFGVEMIGADLAAIQVAERRQDFRCAMEEIGLSVPRSTIANSSQQARDAVNDTGYPAVIRPSFTLGGLDTLPTGEVKRPDGSVVAGLYAAGRTAAGVPRRGAGYSSGISVGDATFSGRRAGAAAAAGAAATRTRPTPHPPRRSPRRRGSPSARPQR